MSCEVHARFCESRGVGLPSATHHVATFRDQADAERFRQEMQERLAAFGLRVAPEKSAVRHFDGSLLQGGSGATADKPTTFTFLGFVHYLTRSKRGAVIIERKPSSKARERFVGKVKAWLKAHRHQPVSKQQAHLKTMLLGLYQYFGLHYCTNALNGVWRRVQKSWWQVLRRRSQKAKRRCDWQRLHSRAWFQLPRPTVTQAWV